MSPSVMDGVCFFTTGELYKTSDFLDVTLITLPDSAKPEDLLISRDSESGEDVLYILGSKRVKENEYINTIWKYEDDETFEEVCSFEYGLSAMSFEKWEDPHSIICLIICHYFCMAGVILCFFSYLIIDIGLIIGLKNRVEEFR